MKTEIVYVWKNRCYIYTEQLIYGAKGKTTIKKKVENCCKTLLILTILTG